MTVYLFSFLLTLGRVYRSLIGLQRKGCNDLRQFAVSTCVDYEAGPGNHDRTVGEQKTLGWPNTSPSRSSYDSSEALV